jgi:hypothetical protein
MPSKVKEERYWAGLTADTAMALYIERSRDLQVWMNGRGNYQIPTKRDESNEAIFLKGDPL